MLRVGASAVLESASGASREWSAPVITPIKTRTAPFACLSMTEGGHLPSNSLIAHLVDPNTTSPDATTEWGVGSDGADVSGNPSVIACIGYISETLHTPARGEASRLLWLFQRRGNRAR